MGSSVVLSPGFCLGLALMILLVPLPWITAMILAAAGHELCHWAVIRLFSRERLPLRLALLGASMPMPAMERWKEVLCALAGPVGSLLLAGMVAWFPRLALCALMQGLWNCLPLYPMDGGRVVQGILDLTLPPFAAQKIGKLAERTSLTVIAGVGFYGSFVMHWGLLPICLAGILLFRGIFGKTPCKAKRLRVQ